MPIYTYKCILCGFIEEEMKSVEERDEGFGCPQENCTGVMKRDLDAPSFRLKGGGWYKDGYSKKKQKPKEEKEEE